MWRLQQVEAEMVRLRQAPPAAMPAAAPATVLPCECTPQAAQTVLPAAPKRDALLVPQPVPAASRPQPHPRLEDAMRRLQESPGQAGTNPFGGPGRQP